MPGWLLFRYSLSSSLLKSRLSLAKQSEIWPCAPPTPHPPRPQPVLLSFSKKSARKRNKHLLPLHFTEQQGQFTHWWVRFLFLKSVWWYSCHTSSAMQVCFLMSSYHEKGFLLSWTQKITLWLIKSAGKLPRRLNTKWKARSTLGRTFVINPASR